MSVAIQLDNLSIAYGKSVVVRGVSLQVTPGEQHVLLGESGSGKTTTLRAIAGFEKAKSGTIQLGDRVVDDSKKRLAPEKRGVGVVFQDYALFPHLTVGKNVAYGMKGNDPLPWLERVGLGSYAKRRIDQLSGGEQQRVALARALARRPDVMLLDEPFSNLNRAMRNELRQTTARVLRDANITAVYVTHDVEEAFSLADRISVMHDGLLLQTDTPQALYRRPVSRTVAAALGDLNVIEATAAGEGRVRTPFGTYRNEGATAGNLLVRPSDVAVQRPGSTDDATVGTVTETRFLGSSLELHIAVADQVLVARQDPTDPSGVGDLVSLTLREPVWCVST